MSGHHAGMPQRIARMEIMMTNPQQPEIRRSDESPTTKRRSI
jgi:hypothetical protein